MANRQVALGIIRKRTVSNASLRRTWEGDSDATGPCQIYRSRDLERAEGQPGRCSIREGCPSRAKAAAGMH